MVKKSSVSLTSPRDKFMVRSVPCFGKTSLVNLTLVVLNLIKSNTEKRKEKSYQPLFLN